MQISMLASKGEKRSLFERAKGEQSAKAIKSCKIQQTKLKVSTRKRKHLQKSVNETYESKAVSLVERKAKRQEQYNQKCVKTTCS